ncbi:hypothetical protein RM572_27180 [Streptomyces sp. DSM 42041]|uniref:Secreted protein n=1 Tax=Streptomyces hazeniae TaxID=3075538 RepID=A0ABU2P0S7_9ACTN|nr:hypothetical protein [Streptomyces sp. DSM 42041]MDT0382446.1 hypothetical protein [Streptomyces sp. DSM 42041]
MRTALRTAVAGALAAPLLVVAASGAATADESRYCKEKTRATAHEAITKSVCSEAYTDGTLGFEEDGILTDVVQRLL